jgi:hypothetical protein
MTTQSVNVPPMSMAATTPSARSVTLSPPCTG